MDKKQTTNLLAKSKSLFSLNSLADTYNNKGLKFLEKDDYENAITCFFQSLDYDENYSHAYSNIGNALLQKGNYDDAVKMFEDAIKIDSKNSLYHFNLGVALTKCHDYKGAIKSYKECLKLSPRNKKAIKFLGNCYKDLKMFPEALKCYKKIEKIDPNDPVAQFLQSQIHIRHGRFNIGWKLYEYGLKNNIRKPFSGYYEEKNQLWNGKPFDGYLLVYAEQGLGDQLNFGTIINDLIKVQPKVLIKVDKRLKQIFQDTYPEIIVYGEEDIIPNESYKKYISMGSLCKFFRNHTDDFINSSFQNFKIGRNNNHHVSEFFSEIKGFKIGISWHSFSTENGKSRSLSTDHLAQITSCPNVNFISIQYGNVLKQIKEVKLMNGIDILKVPFTDITKDINSLASIIKNCDLIISVDNSTAHLAASMGHPTWILLPYSADFRWMEDITPAVWYKNSTLIRQNKENDWQNSVDLICDAIVKSDINS